MNSGTVNVVLRLAEYNAATVTKACTGMESNSRWKTYERSNETPAPQRRVSGWLSRNGTKYADHLPKLSGLSMNAISGFEKKKIHTQ